MMKSTLAKFTEDKNLTELLTGSGLVLFFKMLGMLAGYVFIYLITEYLGIESYGIYAICFTVLNIVVVIAKLGLDNASVKSISAYMKAGSPENALLYFRKSFAIVSVSSLVTGAMLYISAGWLAHVFGNNLLENSLKVTALIVIPNALLQIQAEKFRGLKKMAWYSFLINGSIALLAGGLLILFTNLYAPSSELSLWSLGVAISLLWVFISFIRQFNVKASAWNSIPYKTMFTLSIPMLLSGSMFLVMSWTVLLLLGYYLDETQVAIYHIAFKISAVVSVVLYAINAIASPQFSELYEASQHEQLEKLAMQIAKLNFLLTLPVMLGIVVLSKYILGIFGEEYIIGQTVLLILCGGQFFSAICGSVLTLLNMAGKEKTVRNIIGGTALLNVVLNIIFIQLYGIDGAAFATFISLVVWNVLGLIAVKKYFGFVMLPFVR
ncbi:MAG: flippase [Flavobacteriales bacterium]|nr:flippase [Flavobacteriales bacterium]